VSPKKTDGVKASVPDKSKKVDTDNGLLVDADDFGDEFDDEYADDFESAGVKGDP
jgi:hypothetical protein